MDTTKPPLICPACDEPVWPGDAMSIVWPSDRDTGELAGEMVAYHAEHAPELPDTD